MKNKDGMKNYIVFVLVLALLILPAGIYAEAMTPYERNQYSIDILKDWSANENESEC